MPNVTSWNITEEFTVVPISRSSNISETNDKGSVYPLDFYGRRDVLDYRSKQAATPNNNDREKAEAKGGCAKRLTEPPTCPLSTCFLYTCKWLMIHDAFCARCEYVADD